MKNNILTIHGKGFNFDEKDTFGPYILKNAKKYGDVRSVHLPLGNELSLENWTEVMEKYRRLGFINERTIIIAHSLGTLFVPKYLSKKNLKIDTLISIAGGLDENIKESAPLANFMPLIEEMNIAKHNIKHRHFIYSNNDKVFKPEHQQNYINALDATPLFVEGQGHFGRTEGVVEIPQVFQILEEIKLVRVNAMQIQK